MKNDIRIVPRFFKGDTVYYLAENLPREMEDEIVVDGKTYKTGIIPIEEVRKAISERVDMAMKGLGWEKVENADKTPTAQV